MMRFVRALSLLLAALFVSLPALADFTVYPAPGVTVYAEDGVTVIPPNGAVVPNAKYYQDLIRQGMLFTSNPLESSGDPITIAPVTRVSGSLVGTLTTSLSTRACGGQGETVITTGRASADDGAGMTFSCALGVTAGADGYLKINGPNGQWQATTPRNAGYMDPRWFGCVPTTASATVNNCQPAVEAAIAATVAYDLRYVRLTAGFFGVRATSAATKIVIPSSITFACAELGAATFVPITQDTGGTEKEIFEVTGTNVRIENISIYRKDSSQLADPRAPLPLSQQLHGFRIEAFNAAFRNVYVNGVTGAGFIDRTSVGSFQIVMDNCHTSNTGNHGWWLTGNNTWVFDSCSAGTIPNGHAGWKIDSGQFTAKGCNGLYAAYEYPGLPVDWREEDTRVWETGAAQATFIGTNIEEFTSYGIYNTATTAPDLIGVTIFTVKGGMPTTPGGADGRVRAVYSGLIDRPKLLGPGTKLFAPHTGTWGDPESHLNDGCPFESAVGLPPYIFVGDDHGCAKLTTSAVSVNTGKITVGQPFGPNHAVKLPNVQLGNYSFQGTLHTANGTAVPGVNGVDTTAGAVTLTLTDVANAPIGWEYHFNHAKGANNVILVDSTGGSVFEDGAGVVTNNFTFNGVGKNVTVRLATFHNGSAFVNRWSIATRNW